MVQGFEGFRAQDVGSRTWGLGFRLGSLGRRISGLWSRSSGLMFWAIGSWAIKSVWDCRGFMGLDIQAAIAWTSHVFGAELQGPKRIMRNEA